MPNIGSRSHRSDRHAVACRPESRLADKRHAPWELVTVGQLSAGDVFTLKNGITCAVWIVISCTSHASGGFSLSAIRTYYEPSVTINSWESEVTRVWRVRCS